MQDRVTPPMSTASLLGIQSQQHRIPLLSDPACGFPRRAHLAAQSPEAGPRAVGGVVPEGIPVLLFQAHAVVSASTDQEMASRDLAAVLGRHPNTIGPDLCALLREVGVDRPDGGKIKARYAGNGKPLPGFTAACLQRALDAYAARAPGSPATPA